MTVKRNLSLLLTVIIIMMLFLAAVPSTTSANAACTVGYNSVSYNGYTAFLRSETLYAGKTGNRYNPYVKNVKSCVRSGSTLYYTTETSSYTYIYKISVTGKSKKLIKKVSKSGNKLNSAVLQGYYNGYLYYTKIACSKSHVHDYSEGSRLYKLKLSSGKITKVSTKKLDMLHSGLSYGKYIAIKNALGTGPAVSGKIYLYNMSSNSFKKIGAGYQISKINSKYVYYFKFNDGDSRYGYLMKCRYNLKTGKTTVVESY